MGLEQAKNQLLLVQPVPTDKGTLTRAAQGANFPPLGLLTLDALTPKQEWDVRIIDEAKERFDMGRVNPNTLSLVGITSWTNQAPRAYEIAQAFRQLRLGVPVILGGPHPSVLPQEARQCADSVCIGEAEGVWTRILTDVQNGSLQEVYQGGMVSLDQVPIIRHPLRDKYTCGSIQTARGCPGNCVFCSVTAINGGRIRYRPIPDVVEEFASIKQKWLMLADDNFIGTGPRGLDRALRLSQALAELRQQGVKKYWATQAMQILGGDKYNELLGWMYKAGCRAVLLGLESINEDVVADMNKGINKVGDYKKHIRNIQAHGIAVIGSFFFGSDFDSPTVFEDTVNFIKTSGVAAQNLNLLCPLPGTKLFNQACQSGRLLYTNFPDDWEKYNLKEAVYQPKEGSALNLVKKRGWAERELNNKRTLFRRTLHTLLQTRSPHAAMMALVWNSGGSWRMRDYRKQIKQLEKKAA